MADISRSEVSTLIEEAYSHVLLDAAVASSSVLQAFPQVNMGTKLIHMPVLGTLPTASWVSETEDKSTAEVTWKDLTLVAEEIAVIIPVHENVLDDATVDVLTEITTRGGEAIGKVLDKAVLFGVNKPASWVSDDLLSASVAASQTVGNDTGDANVDDLVGTVNQAARAIAADGLVPDTLLAPLTLRYDVANIRDGLGAPIFRDEQFGGFKTVFNRNGAWDPVDCELFIVDSSRVRIGVRQDIQVKLLDQATLTVGESTINLAQRDMIAIRMKARYAYVLGISTTSLGNDVTPVAAVLPAGC
jgi:HK97 family phage major capsid protein